MPLEQMQDRQNGSPALGELLSDPLAVAYSGYIVRAVREDERLTVDTVYYPFTVEGLARALEVAREFPPDEQGEVVLVDGTRALVLWWDEGNAGAIGQCWWSRAEIGYNGIEVKQGWLWRASTLKPSLTGLRTTRLKP